VRYVGTPALPDHEPEVVRPDETLEPNATADEKKPNDKSTVSATVELLRGVRDSAGAFGPLKSLARSLCLVLDNCEVLHPSRTFHPPCLRSFQRTEVNECTIDSLAPRVKILSESLSDPILPGDINEKERAKKLEQSVHILQDRGPGLMHRVYQEAGRDQPGYELNGDQEGSRALPQKSQDCAGAE